MKYWQHGETGRVVATENELVGEWYKIDEDQYKEALHPLSPANTVLQADEAKLCPHCALPLIEGACPGLWNLRESLRREHIVEVLPVIGLTG